MVAAEDLWGAEGAATPLPEVRSIPSSPLLRVRHLRRTPWHRRSRSYSSGPPGLRPAELRPSCDPPPPAPPSTSHRRRSPLPKSRPPAGLEPLDPPSSSTTTAQAQGSSSISSPVRRRRTPRVDISSSRSRLHSEQPPALAPGATCTQSAVPPRSALQDHRSSNNIITINNSSSSRRPRPRPGVPAMSSGASVSLRARRLSGGRHPGLHQQQRSPLPAPPFPPPPHNNNSSRPGSSHPWYLRRCTSTS